ncbi:hypothetical protein [Myxococcus sp. RHSTA-1-4]|uniref:hypothetical protein n=1 Tax=Myxococcus sp. RHSTA-1-4 TaxID=2874601 RepID=UPI001CC0FC7A|nr:hypothetical protein [Myxococcus sp. RHSTA-1-4]MBZ4418525.1 hypothetical protein [Myxococcus sp. RHSTA-1-4]
MGLAPTSGSSGASGANAAAEAARRAEAARAEAARRAAEAARAAAEAARKAAEAARRAAEAARQQQAAAQKAAADAQKAAQKPGQTPEAAAKSKADAAAADKALKQAADKYATADRALQAAEEKVALTAKKAEEAMGQANTVATQEKKPQPFTQKDIDAVKPKKNELVSAFDGSHRKAELEKLLGTTAPGTEPAYKPQAGEKPPESLDALDAKDIADARKVQDGKTYTDPSSGAKYQVKKDVTTGDTVLSDKDSGNTVTLKPDGSYTSTVQVKEKTQSGGTRETAWTKTSDAKGHPTSLESRKTQTEKHPETGLTTTSSNTQYDARRSPPVPMTRSEEVRMEKPPAALAQRQGVPQGPASMKTETQFNAQGIPTKQLKTTEIHTPGYDAAKVGSFESGQNTALQNASKGEDHHKTHNGPHGLKPGESSLTITEETRFNAKGEPATSKQKTESVSVQAMPSDKNGNGVQVARAQQEVTRGPRDAVVTDNLPAISSKTPGNVTARSVVTGYDPDGSKFDDGYANRTQTVLQGSGTVDANGQTKMSYQPTEVKSLQEAGGNRWKYDHVGFETGADGKPVPGKEPKELDKERQLPWYEDAKDFVTEGLSDLANFAGDVASDALGFAKDVVLAPVDAAIDQLTAPLEKELTDEIKKLNSAGDTLTLSGNLDVKVGLKAGIQGEAEIERTADGKYQLSAEVTGDVGVGLVGSASVSAGGRMEFKFDTPEEAAKAAIILGKGPAALASGGEDHKFLAQHLSAMEVNVGVEAEAGLGAKFGPGGAELSASLGATSSYRVEFDKGKPTHLVRTTEIEGSGAAGVATGLKGKLGFNVGGDVSGTVSLETRLPLDASKLDGKDVLAFLASPATAMFAGPAETSISVEGSVDLGNQGHFFTAEISGLSGDEVQNVTTKLLDGKFENAFDDVKVEAQVTTGSFKDRELGLGAKLGVVDFDVNARHRDVTAEGGSGNGGTTVSLGPGRRRGGSDGPSGSSGSSGSRGSSGTHGSTGSASTGGTNKPSGRPGDTSTAGDSSPGTERPSGDANRPPPTEYRVNPATGQLVPVTPRDNGTSRTERPGTPGATEAPRDTDSTTGRRPVPVVRNPDLPGRTTHVRYDGGRVRIEAGPDATRADIEAHMETARALQRYEGAAGKVRQLIDKVKQAITGMPGYGSQGFESRLEVQKLNNILKSLQATQAQIDGDIRGATGANTPQTAAQRADLERRISSVENQLRTHESQVNSLTAGRGYVAMEDDVTPRTHNSAPLKYESLSEGIRNTYSAEEVAQVANHGRSLGLNDQQIADFLEVGAIKKSKNKPVPSAEDLQQQMTNWKTEIEPRGFPYKFESKEQLAEFQQKIKELSERYGLPEGSMVIQGSSLRTPEAKDVDVAIFVSDEVFDAFAQRSRDAMEANFKDPTSKKSRNNLKELDRHIEKGFVPMYNFPRLGGERAYDGMGSSERTFTKDFKEDVLKAMGLPPDFPVDFSIMRRSSKMDMYPSVTF